MAVDRDGEGLLYQRLQVAADATEHQIRRAYRRLVHDVHPDAHPDDPAASRRFRELTEAYELLIDPAARARYGRRRLPPAEPPADRPAPVRRRPVPPGSAPLRAGPVRIEPWRGR